MICFEELKKTPLKDSFSIDPSVIQHFLQLFLSAAINVIFQLVLVLHQLNSPRSPLKHLMPSYLCHYKVGCGLNILQTV